MLTLGIETSGNNPSIALLDGEAVLEIVSLRQNNRPEIRTLPISVEKVLGNHSIKPEELNLLAISRGPGSFTGLRIGLVFAKMFGYLTKVPLFAVDSFAACVEQIKGENEFASGQKIIEVVEDLRKGQIAWQRYFLNKHSSWEPEQSISVSPLEQWLKMTREDVTLTGTGLTRVLKQVARHTSEVELKVVAEEKRSPDAVSVALVGKRLSEKSSSESPFELTPYYVRRSAAEEKTTVTLQEKM